MALKMKLVESCQIEIKTLKKLIFLVTEGKLAVLIAFHMQFFFFKNYAVLPN